MRKASPPKKAHGHIYDKVWIINNSVVPYH